MMNSGLKLITIVLLAFVSAKSQTMPREGFENLLRRIDADIPRWQKHLDHFSVESLPGSYAEGKFIRSTQDDAKNSLNSIHQLIAQELTRSRLSVEIKIADRLGLASEQFTGLSLWSHRFAPDDPQNWSEGAAEISGELIAHKLSLDEYLIDYADRLQQDAERHGLCASGEGQEHGNAAKPPSESVSANPTQAGSASSRPRTEQLADIRTRTLAPTLGLEHMENVPPVLDSDALRKEAELKKQLPDNQYVGDDRAVHEGLLRQEFVEGFKDSKECNGITFYISDEKVPDFAVQITVTGHDDERFREQEWVWFLSDTRKKALLAIGTTKQSKLAAGDVCRAIWEDVDPNHFKKPGGKVKN